MLGRKNGKRGEILLGLTFMFTCYGFSQQSGFTTNIYAAAGYPFNLKKDIHLFLLDSMNLEKQFYYSYTIGAELEFADKLRIGGGINTGYFNYENGFLDVSIIQYNGYLNLGYNWRFNDKLSFENSLLIGATQLRQRMNKKSIEEDIWNSYINNNQNIYYKSSEVGFLIGHSLTLNYAINSRLSVYCNFLYSFNRSRSLTIDEKVVFSYITTPSIGLAYQISSFKM